MELKLHKIIGLIILSEHMVY